MNIFFADNNDLYKKSFINVCSEFNELDDDGIATVDVLIVDGGASIERFRSRFVNTCFCPSTRYFDVISSMRVKSAVSCGMCEKDSVTFSSIGENHAMVCLKRNIFFLNSEFEPCEFRVNFDRTKGLYSNLALGTLEYFVKKFGES